MLLCILAFSQHVFRRNVVHQAKMSLNPCNLLASLILLGLCYYQEIELNGNFRYYFADVFAISNYLPMCSNSLWFGLFVYSLLQRFIFQTSAMSHTTVFPLQKV